MREAISRILRVGLVNSGMFDTLVLNTDVRAIHLIGDNNVGKTSLIELIQFLYFPDVREMHFSKSLAETLSFYFRPEGSYMLFEVRTVRGTQRTLGIYGTGTADSRQVFVFNGPFDLADFLDERRHVVGIQQVGQRLADRRFHIYQKVEDHERGLVGEHSDDRANIHIFELPRGNFRLLRRLLQNLLRLERLTSHDIRSFLNALVESTGAKTRIDITRDFDRKYSDIRAIRERIAALTRLKPLIEQWEAATQRLEHVRAEEFAARHRLGHTALRYSEALDTQRLELLGRLTILNDDQHRLNEDRERLSGRLSEENSQKNVLQQLLKEYERLTQQCAGRQEVEVRAERDYLTYQVVTLQKTIDRNATTSPDVIERRLKRLHDEQERLHRQRDGQTIEHLLTEAGLDDDTRMLLHFLLAENLLSLTIQEAIHNVDIFLAAARTASTMVDEHGAFFGFGLAIPRTTWHRPHTHEQPLRERLADTERQITETEHELAISHDREQAQRQLLAARRQAEQLEKILHAFQRLKDLDENEGGQSHINERLIEHNRRISELKARQQPLNEQSQHVQDAQVTARSNLNDLEQTQRDITGILRDVGEVTGACPEDIIGLNSIELPDLLILVRRQHSQCRSAIQPAISALGDAQARLADMHEREAPDVSFDTWVIEKQLLTGEIERLEGQLRENYRNLMTLVKGELDKLIQAFEAVQSRVAELNTMIRRVSISNIERIELHVQKSHLVEAIHQTSRIQLDLFSPVMSEISMEEAEKQIEELVVGTLRTHGRQLSLDDLFQLEFQVTFAQTGEQRTVAEIHAFESNGTAIGVKIVVYLGLIRLLQGSRRGAIARIPFFLDEVGSLSSNNVRQIITYCDQHNFLPILPARQSAAISHIRMCCGDTVSVVSW